jgi:hypothetical protein
MTMPGYDTTTKELLKSTIQNLRSQIGKRNDKDQALNELADATEQLSVIEGVHQKFKGESKKLTQDIYARLRQFKEQHELQHEKEICDYIIRSINEIEELVNRAGNSESSSIKEQRIYIMTIGLLEHWRPFLYGIDTAHKTLSFNRLYRELHEFHPASEADLIDVFGSSGITYQSQLDKGLTNLLAQYTNHQQLSIQITVATDQDERLYSKLRDHLTNELALALTSEKLVSAKSSYREIFKQARQLIQAVDEDVSKRNIDYKTANQLLEEADGILQCFKLEYSEPNNRYSKAVNHAKQIAQLADQHKDNKKAKTWGYALLFAGLALITLAVIAFLAVSSGSFLGLTFATTAIAKTVTGLNVVVMSEAAKGALVGGFFSGILGVSSIAGAINRFFYRPELATTAERFTSQATSILEDNKNQPSFHLYSNK